MPVCSDQPIQPGAYRILPHQIAQVGDGPALQVEEQQLADELRPILSVQQPADGLNVALHGRLVQRAVTHVVDVLKGDALGHEPPAGRDIAGGRRPLHRRAAKLVERMDVHLEGWEAAGVGGGALASGKSDRAPQQEPRRRAVRTGPE